MLRRRTAVAPRSMPGTLPSPTPSQMPGRMLGNGLHLPLDDGAVTSLLERLRDPAPPSHDGVFLVDWAGIRTRIAMLPWAPQELAGTTTDRLPVPDDGYRSEAQEYAALALSLVGDRDEHRIVEVGSGWAPWAVMGAALARRLGKRPTAIAVEADALRASWAMQHAADNDLGVRLADPSRLAEELAAGDEVTIVPAAAWTHRTTLRFPVLDDGDMGGAVTAERSPTIDYRGAHLAHLEVETIALADLLGETTDLLHIDLQGMELEVVLPALPAIEEHVRFLAIGTHDRYVEGVLQRTLLEREWALLAESPSTARFDGVKPTLAGFTVQDGNQLYANPRFRDADDLVVRPGRRYA